jgi:4-amino-4-deoxy-L-arabinose transferase-like glycosyltransferase
MRMPASALAALLVFAVALALRLAAAGSDLETLLLRYTSDDAFYYFQIARNLAAGLGPSLDGETPTNGFHPLWLLLVTGVQRLSGDPERALRLGLWLGALLGAGSVALAYACARRLTAQPAAGLLAAGLYAVHPVAIAEAVNGLETALAVFGFAVLVWLFLAAPPDGSLRLRSAAGLGLVGGLACLARSDLAVPWAVLLAALALRSPRRLAALLLAGAVSAAVVAPWLAWSWLRFGSPVPVSAVALPVPLQQDHLARWGGGLGVMLERSAFLVREAFAETIPHLYLVPRSVPAWLGGLAGLLILVGLPWLPVEPEGRLARRRLARFAAPLAGVVLLVLVHAGVRWWTREWYFAPVGWCLAVLAGLAGAQLRELADRAPRPLRGGLALAVAAGVSALAVWLPAPENRARWGLDSPHRVQQLEAARWLSRNTLPSARIGAFNAGILAYFSERTVVNLDGAVNADAYAARRDGRLFDYVLERRIGYLVDWSGTLPLAGCRDSPRAHCTNVTHIGERIEGFAGSPIAVKRVFEGPPPPVSRGRSGRLRR